MLDFHKEQFAQALHDSSNDRALTVEYLTQALEDASNTSTNWERKNINFESVKDMDHDEALKVTELTQQNGWENTYRQIHTLEATDPVAARVRHGQDAQRVRPLVLLILPPHTGAARNHRGQRHVGNTVPVQVNTQGQVTGYLADVPHTHRADLRRNLAVRLIGSRSRGCGNPGTPGAGPGPVSDGNHRLPRAGVPADHVPHQIEEILKLPDVMRFEFLLPGQHPGHKLLINTQILRDAPRSQIPAE